MSRPRMPIGAWGSIAVRPLDGGFQARCYVRDGDGITRRIGRTGRTKTMARNALLEALTVRRRAAVADAEMDADTLLMVVVDRWLQQSSDSDRHAEQTQIRYAELRDSHLQPRLAGVSLREATVTRLDAVLQGVVADSGPGTARLCRSILSGAMSLAVRHGAVPANPVRSVGEIRSTKAPTRAMTIDQVHLLRAGALAWEHGRAFRGIPAKRAGGPPRGDIVDVVDVLVGTGARIGEILALRWPDIDLGARAEQCTICRRHPDDLAEHARAHRQPIDDVFPIQPQLTISGTVIRGSAGLVRQPRGKTETSHRTLLLPPFTVATLLARQVQTVIAAEDDLVFPSTTGGLRDPANVRKPWRAITRGVGLDWVTPKTCRATVATTIVELEAAAGQLGHATTTVTARHYRARSMHGPDVRDVLEAFADVPAEPVVE